MFAIYSPPVQHFQTHFPFHTRSMHHASPLAPRDPNAFSSLPSAPSFFSKMTESNYSKQAPAISTDSSRYNYRRPRLTHTRGSKFATLTEGKDKESQREKRRREYLDKVKEEREGKRFEARGEQGLRRDWIEERKAWWEEKEREAESWMLEEAEEDVAFDGADEMDEVEKLAMEEQMLDAMAMEAEDWDQDVSEEREMTDYGSEDEDYEKLMMDIATQAEGGADSDFASSAKQEDQGMDLS